MMQPEGKIQFRDTALQLKWEKDNWFVTPFLNAEEVTALKASAAMEMEKGQPGFFLSVWTENLQSRARCDAAIRKVFLEKVQALAGNVKPVIHSFALKQPGRNSSWHIHQDDSFTDETRFESFSVWVALGDTSFHNGAMQLVEGSHRFSHAPRSSSIPKPFRELHDIIGTEYLRTIPMRAGEALVFGHRLIHASGPNLSNADRLGAVGVYLPSDAPLMYYFRKEASPGSPVEKIKLPDDYYLRFPLGERPEGEGVMTLGEMHVEPECWNEAQWAAFFLNPAK